MPTNKIIAICLACSFVVFSACKEGKQTCIEGASSACVCPDGASGSQVCSAEGTFSPCSCGSGEQPKASGETAAKAIGATGDASVGEEPSGQTAGAKPGSPSPAEVWSLMKRAALPVEIDREGLEHNNNAAPSVTVAGPLAAHIAKNVSSKETPRVDCVPVVDGSVSCHVWAGDGVFVYVVNLTGERGWDIRRAEVLPDNTLDEP